MSGIRDRNNGFLLVELLSAMSVLAIILVVLGVVVSFTVRASARADALSIETEEASRLVHALLRDIDGLSPQRWSGDDRGYIFSGSPHRVTFAQITAGPYPELNWVEIAATAEGTLRIERSLPPSAMNESELPPPSSSMMLSARYRISLAYFVRLANGGEMLVDTWSDTSQMPAAIRVVLVDGPSKTRELRLPIHVSEHPQCGAEKDAACSEPSTGKRRPEPEW